MRLSVVMTTYNGARYIAEQLNTIICQTKPVNEIIVRDDCSTDRTYQIVQEISISHPEIEWNIGQNEKNLGFFRNYLSALPAVTGDIIFLADQDDVWIADKVDKMHNAFMRENSMLLLSSAIQIMDRNGNEIKGLTQSANMVLMNKEGYLQHLNGKIDAWNAQRLLGCTIAFRRELIDLVFRVNLQAYDCRMPSHDSLLEQVAYIHNGMWFLNEVLLKYRLHDKNTSLSRMKYPKNYAMNHYVDSVRSHEIQLCTIIRTFISDCSFSPQLGYYRDNMTFFAIRRVMLTNKMKRYSVSLLIKNWEKYRIYTTSRYWAFRMLLKDVILHYLRHYYVGTCDTNEKERNI